MQYNCQKILAFGFGRLDISVFADILPLFLPLFSYMAKSFEKPHAPWLQKNQDSSLNGRRLLTFWCKAHLTCLSHVKWLLAIYQSFHRKKTDWNCVQIEKNLKLLVMLMGSAKPKWCGYGSKIWCTILIFCSPKWHLKLNLKWHCCGKLVFWLFKHALSSSEMAITQKCRN